MGKYFKYAIGEIILVVIGILIALQVNNWNENRKLIKQQKGLTASIKKDLKADITYLNEYIEKLRRDYEILQDQSIKVNRISYSKDSLIHFLKKEIYIFSVTFEGFNNNSYESIKTSGKLDILDEALKQPLYELSILQSVNYDKNQGLANDYYDEIENLVRYYPIQVPFAFIKDTSQNDFVWKNMNKKDMILNLNSWGTVKANYLRVTLGDFIKILEKTKVVLKLLE
ncbi:DUF6090 family protein [Winogradskyella sp.]|uniref:DUF6090 family protein n=1 Tax=Winogradskyella sp. TaxID=1883156 RepID=UPI0025F24D5A|nr:DUF6090 family protein [Winogradskyella sp.]